MLVQTPDGQPITVNMEQPSNIDGSLNTSQIYPLAFYKQDKARDDVFFDTVTL